MAVETEIKPQEEALIKKVTEEVKEISNEEEKEKMQSISLTDKVQEKKKKEEDANKANATKKDLVKKGKKKGKSLMQKLKEFGTISSKEVIEFTRHLAVMLGAGVTIFEAITFLKDQTKNKAFSGKLDEILDNLNNGSSLSNSMKKYPKIFPGIYTNIVGVGEQSGTLSQTMVDLADHLEESDQFKSKVKGALIYPKIILSVMILFLFVLFFFVMPRILTIFYSLNAEIPTATKITIGITNFVQNNLLLMGVGILGLFAFFYFISKNPATKRYRDIFYLKVPFVGHIVLNYNTTQVAQHFGTLFESGLTVVKCLEITQTVVNNSVFQDEIGHMVHKIKNGTSLSQSFKEKTYFPPMFTKLIKVGERTGKLPHVIKYMKGYYKGLVDNDVKNITSIIEPVIMVLLGLMVTGLVVTVIGPIYQLISNVSQ